MVIDTLEGVQLGGITQWIRVRGADASNPVLLLMQQGPGLPIINDARRLEHLSGWNMPSRLSTGTSGAPACHHHRCARTRTGSKSA